MNRVLLGDCLDLLWRLDDESVDLVTADLPYGLTQNRWDQKIDVELLWEHYGRIIKPRGVIALTAQGVFGAELIVAAKELYRYSMVWKKNKTGGFLNVHRQPLRTHEDIHIFYRKQPRYTPIKTQGHAPTHAFTKHTSDGSNYGQTKRGISNKGGRTDRYPTSILEIPVVNNDDPIRVHSVQKPVELGAWFIRSFTRPGDLVVDNACGSGAFLVAAKRLGRRFWGCDIDPESVRNARSWLRRTRVAPVQNASDH